MVTFRREIINHKFVVVVRENPKGRQKKGTIITKRKWSPKRATSDKDATNINHSVELFKQNKTLFQDFVSNRLKNVREFTDHRKNAKPRKNLNYQYIFSALIKGEVITARSKIKPPDFPVSEAREEASINFHERVAQKLNFDYEARLGIEAIGKMRKPPIIKEGIVYYKPI